MRQWWGKWLLRRLRKLGVPPTMFVPIGRWEARYEFRAVEGSGWVVVQVCDSVAGGEGIGVEPQDPATPAAVDIAWLEIATRVSDDEILAGVDLKE